MFYFARWKIWLVAVVLVGGVIFALPNVFSRQTVEQWPSWLPYQQINLGLDLEGGSHLLLAVDIESVVREQLTSVVDSVRASLRKANIGYTDLGVSGNSVVLKLRDPGLIETARPLLRDAAQGLDVAIATDGSVRLTFTDQAIAERQKHAVEQSIEIVRRRIDETGTREPAIQRQGENWILIQLPGVKDPARIKEILGKTAKMTFRFVDTSVSGEDVKAGRVPLPAGTELLASADEEAGGGQPRLYVVQKRVMVSGENLVDAQPTFDRGMPVVSFRFDSIGARRFGDATRENVGRIFAIVLDNEVISAPVIRDAILGGSGIISGSFTTQAAQDLSLLLRAGALPAPLTVIEERTVGADLGADSIRAGVYACIIGLALVAVYMVAAYGLFGLFANVAMIFNLVITLAALSLLQATLTLPGMAGLLLTLGMSVDANVLINERIREETRAGRSPVGAIDAGFKRAFATILDSNLTTLIKMLLLFGLGAGAVKGFAVTISLGILISMFTAILLVRLMIVLWLRRTRPKMLPV